MNSDTRWTVARQLGAGFGTLLVLLLAVAGLGSWGLYSTIASLKTVYEDRTAPLQQLAGIRFLATRDRVLLLDAVLHADPATTAKRLTEYAANRQQSQLLWAQYTATVLTPEEQPLAADLAITLDALDKQGIQPGFEALQAGRQDDARRALDHQVSRLSPLFTAAMTRLIDLQVRVARDEYSAGQDLAHRLSLAVAGLVGTALLLGGAIAIAITRRPATAPTTPPRPTSWPRAPAPQRPAAARQWRGW